MSGFAAYTMFAAIRLHFTSDKYDYFKYRGSVRSLKQSNFESHKDAWRFEKLARDYSGQNELQLMMACNFAANDNLKWIGDLQSSEARENYLKTRAALDSLQRWFKREMEQLFSKHTEDELYNVIVSPVLARGVLSKEIIPLLPVVLDQNVLRFLSYWEAESNNVVVRSLSTRLIKYQPFVDQKRKDLAEIYQAARDDT